MSPAYLSTLVNGKAMGQSNQKNRIVSAFLLTVYYFVIRSKQEEVCPQFIRNSGHRQVCPSPAKTKGLCFMNTPEEIYEELSHLEQLWHQFNKRKRALEINEAKQGIGVVVAITIELDEVIQRMNEIEDRYHILKNCLTLASKQTV
jgi:hypothetical protein